MRFVLLLLLLHSVRVWPANAAAPAPAASPVKEKAVTIIVPRIDFHEARLGEAMQFLCHKSRQLDPARTGVNVVLRIAGDVQEKRATLALKDSPLLEIVRELANLTDCVIQAEPSALVLQPKDYKAEVRQWTDDDAKAREVEDRLAAITVTEATSPMFPEAFATLSDAANAAIAPVSLHSRLPAELAKEREVWMTVSHLSLKDALRYLCESADLRMRISRHGVDLFPNRASMDARNRQWWKTMEQSGDATPPVLATAADVETFLRRNGETARNFAAAYAVTQDQQWLERGRKRFPDDPGLLFFACEMEKRPAERRALAALAQKADPDSVQPWLFEASGALDQGNAQEGLRAFRAALAKPHLRLDLEWLVPEKTLLLLEAGEEPAEAESTVLMGTNASVWLAAIQLTGKLKKLELAGEERIALGWDLIKLSERYEKAGLARLLIGELVINAIERTALEFLPQEKEVPELGTTPSARTKELEIRRDAIGELSKRSRESEESPDEKDPAAIREFLRRVRTEGEEKALRWALERKAGVRP